MASTRNKNQQGDYRVEQLAYNQQFAYKTNKEYSIVNPTYLAGDGLIQGRVPDSLLARNPQDIESFLFGIDSTNLVKPQGPVSAQLKCISSASIMHKVPLIMPHDLYMQPNQREPIFGSTIR